MSEVNSMSPGVAYLNGVFLESDEGRPLRILSEYLEPHYRLKQECLRDTVVFFGSARVREDGPLGRYYHEARELARALTAWALTLPEKGRFVVCTGGGPGIMEAANRGAAEAGGKTLGLNIGLPHEQRPNPYLSPNLSFEFRYFFMRKLWFSHLARALVVFPGGFGTLDELFEFLTLCQTRKLKRDLPVLLYGASFWNEVMNLRALVKYGMISEDDLALFTVVDDPVSALTFLQENLPLENVGETLAFAQSCSPSSRPAPPSDGAKGEGG